MSESFLEQMQRIGVGSLWLVFVVSLFTGAVAAVQAAYQFSNVVPCRASRCSTLCM